LWLSFTGCQPAGRYGKPVPKPTQAQLPSPPPRQEAAKAALSADIAWMPPNALLMDSQVPIEFVHAGSVGVSATAMRDDEKNRQAWQQLPQFWNESKLLPRPHLIVAALGGSSVLTAGLLVAGPAERAIKIKVPFGLDDPSTHIPAVNPPTLGKWELGKRLFFDSNNLLPADLSQKEISCTTCHEPARGFTSRRLLRPKPPTLINCVFNTSYFWDGRASALEEVVQRILDDEGARSDVQPDQRHVWSGVITRLRANPGYVDRFKRVFGTPPTQDAVGKALATYMRTILSGSSIHDLAEKNARDRGGNALEASDYDKVLNTIPAPGYDNLLKDPNIPALIDPKEAKKSDIAKHLHAGYTLFHGKAGCLACHSGRNFTDNRFHNIGVGQAAISGPESGRFAALPLGLKDRRMIGAFKTPTLRALPRTAPYFHDGLRDNLFDAVHLHVGPLRPGQHIDPEIRDRKLTQEEKLQLVLWLRALDGDPVPAEVANPPK
jgi:cytochrome c peroxidase